MPQFILALDQGTTSCRAILFDHDGRVRGVAQKEITQNYPQPGWVEQDANEILDTQVEVARRVLADTGTAADDVAAIGITNQRETTVVWDYCNSPISPAIVWQDRRTAGYCAELRRQGHGGLVRAKTGLVLDPYFSASKLKWIGEHTPRSNTPAEAFDFAFFGTIDAWLLANLAADDGVYTHHTTDVSNASRTMLFNIHEHRWDPELVRLFEVPPGLLPTVRSSSEVYANTDDHWFGRPIPIAGIAGDQQAALFGQCCFDPGMCKVTYGTGCFLLMNTGATPVPSEHGLLTTVAWQVGGVTTYAIEGSVFMGGAVVQWLRDGLGIVRTAAEVEPLAASVPDSGGVYLVPAFAGLGAPHWDPHARGTIVGLTRGTTAAHLARAALEGIAFQVADVLDVMRVDTGLPIRELRVDGGASANDLLMQFQADILQMPIVRPVVTETTALGAAYLAGLAVGFWKGQDELRALWKADRTFEPRMSADEANYRRSRWADALRRSREWDDAEAKRPGPPGGGA